MKGKIERLQGDSWSAGVFAPENPAAQPLPLIVMNLSDPAGLEPLLPELKRKMGKEMRPAYLAALDGSDWNRDYSPWLAPPLRPGQAPFPGGAPQRLRLLTEQVLPSLRAHYPIRETPEDTGIFGYSLGGLAALYMAYESPEFGLVGCMLLLALLGAIILRCVWVARRACSPQSAFIAMGYAGMLIAQVAVNVGMCLYVFPVVGITLPFISYGGSSILTMFAAMGIVSSIKMRALPDWLRDRNQL